jgi:predicted small metal-binding protein
MAFGGTMARKVADCRDFPSESGCTLTIAGEEDEVLAAAAAHAVAVHGHEDNGELRNWLRENLKDEASV